MDSFDDPLLDENSGTDRISNLPLSILSHILSFLPTEDAVATSLLSTQWKTFFPLICNLSVTFSEDSWGSRRSDSSFVDFVNQVLNVTFRDMPRIDTVNFFCSQQMHYHDWIRSVVRLKVQTLRIDDWNFPLKSPVMLLHSLIDCKTLKNLTLGQYFVLDVPEGGITFPSLRTLSLREIEFVDENSIQRLLNGSPRLEYLTLHFFCEKALKFPICLSSLKSLDLSIPPLNFKIILDTPKLEYLKYCGTLDYFVLDVPEGGITFPCLRTLFLQWIDVVDENSIQRLLNASPRLEYLTLYFFGQKALKLPICLGSLKSLDLSVPPLNFKIILDTPKLEYLKYCGTLDYIHPVKKLDVLQRADILFVLGQTGIQQCRTDLTKFIAACSNVNQLKLRIWNTRRLPMYYSHVLPELTSLINLQLGIPDIGGWELLADFFLKAPKLKSLCISGISAEIPYETFLRAMPKVLPTCLSGFLNKFEFEVLDREEDALKVIQYFLENANLLQEIRIGFWSRKEPPLLLWKLQKMGWRWKLRKLPTDSNMRKMLWKNLLLGTTWTQLI